MNEKGQSLFEVVLALWVITAICVGIVSLTASSIRNASFSKNKTLAGRYAQEASEWLRSERDTDFIAFQTHALTTTWCLSALDWTKVGVCGGSDNIPNTPLLRDVTFSSDLVSGKTIIEANIRVYWTDAQGSHETRNVTYFTDWRQR
mgnify:FL=1